MGQSAKPKALDSGLCPPLRELRRLRAADLLGAMRIERECFRKTDKMKLKEYLEMLENGGTAFVVGFPVRAVIWLGSLNKKTAEVVSLATLPQYRRRGYADMLLEYAIAHMREGHYIRAMLDVRVSNQGAIKLYERFGFRKTKVKDLYYEDEDAWEMQLRL